MGGILLLVFQSSFHKSCTSPNAYGARRDRVRFLVDVPYLFIKSFFLYPPTPVTDTARFVDTTALTQTIFVCTGRYRWRPEPGGQDVLGGLYIRERT